MAMPIANFLTETQKSSSDRAGRDDGASIRKRDLINIFFKSYFLICLLFDPQGAVHI